MCNSTQNSNRTELLSSHNPNQTSDQNFQFFQFTTHYVQGATVMWSETVGLRTRPVSDQKVGLGLGLAGLVLCCETRSCYARRHNDLEVHSNFWSTVLSIVSLFCVWNITTVEINNGVYLLRGLNPPSAFVYFRLSWSWYGALVAVIGAGRCQKTCGTPSLPPFLSLPFLPLPPFPSPPSLPFSSPLP